MKKVLIIKTGAAGDVIRTTPIIHILDSCLIDWFIDKANAELLQFNRINNIIYDIDQISNVAKYDIVISLDDDVKLIKRILDRIKYDKIYGAFFSEEDGLKYTAHFADWFDMGLISKYGKKYADEKKFLNRKTYQEIIFNGLSEKFTGQKYFLPTDLPDSDLNGDIAIALEAGKRWPNKNWYYMSDLVEYLRKKYKVNILPKRDTLKHHIADIKNHRYLISGDSLPMHIALGLGIPCTGFFICTSPWEIYDYNLLEKIISPKLADYFYSTEYNEESVKSISFYEGLRQIENHLLKRAVLR